MNFRKYCKRFEMPDNPDPLLMLAASGPSSGRAARTTPRIPVRISDYGADFTISDFDFRFRLISVTGPSFPI
jgi:hypothetical protein